MITVIDATGTAPLVINPGQPVLDARRAAALAVGDANAALAAVGSAIASATAAQAALASCIAQAAAAGGSATNAGISAAQAALAAAAANVLPSVPSALPYQVTAISGGVGTGSGGTDGWYVGGVSGGPAGFAWSVQIASGKIAGYRIDNAGISTSTTAPTLTLPSGTGMTGATSPTATVGTIPVGRSFFASTSDSQYAALWQNAAGSLAAVNGPDSNQVKLPLAGLMAKFSFSASTLNDLGVTPDGQAIIAGFYDDQAAPNMWFGLDTSGRLLVGGLYLPTGKTMAIGRETITASAESNYAWLLRDPSGNPLVGYNTDDGSLWVPTLNAVSDIKIGGRSYLDAIAATRKDRLTRWRMGLSSIANGASLLLTLALLGDSWTYFSTLYTPILLARLKAIYGDGGDGLISFATSSGLPSAPAAVSNPTSAVFTITTPVGSWSYNSTYTAPTATLTEQVSNSSGSRIQVAASGASVNTVIKLLYRPIAGSSIRYSWDGGATWQTTIDLSTGYVASLTGLPASGTWTLLIEDNGASARCALTGLVARKASGLLIHKVGSPGSTSAQWAAQAGTAGFRAHWAELNPDCLSILHGTNDQTIGSLGATVAANYATIAAGVRAAAPWTSQPPVDLLYAAPAENLRSAIIPMPTYATAIRAQAISDGAAYLNLQSAMGPTTATAWWQGDLIHPNQTYGGPALARAFLETLDR